MYSYEDHFPYILKGDNKIKVELYEVNNKTLLNIDKLEGYPHFYNRDIILTDNKEECHIYFMTEHPKIIKDIKIIECGD